MFNKGLIFLFLLLVSVCAGAAPECNSMGAHWGELFKEASEKVWNFDPNQKNPLDGANALYEHMLKLSKEYNASGQGLPHYPMSKHYYYRQYISGTSGMKYLSREERRSKKVVIKKGKAYDQLGNKLDTMDSTHVFVISNASLYVSKERSYSGKVKHASLAIGVPVSAAGEIKFKKGRLVDINSDSGRYRTPNILMKRNLLLLREQGLEVPESLIENYSRPEYRVDNVSRLESLGIDLTLHEKQSIEEHIRDFEKEMIRWKDQAWNEDAVWEAYDRMLLEGKLPKHLNSIGVEIVMKSLLVSQEKGFSSDYVYELAYLIPFLDYSMFKAKYFQAKDEGVLRDSSIRRVERMIDKLDHYLM